ncbi:MAG: hypothetical protein ABIV25_04580, partial [Paracoccaceae bacterium]
NFANLVTILAASGGVVAAWIGLFTWKAQSKWDLDNQIAHKILVLLYRHKDSLSAVRYIAILRGETDDAVAGKDLPTDQRRRKFVEIASVYEKRWSKVGLIRSELYPLLLEGQALWGKSFNDMFNPLWVLERELVGVVRIFLAAIDPENSVEMQNEYSKIRREKRDILYEVAEPKDEFRSDYEEGLLPIEDYLRQKLGRK